MTRFRTSPRRAIASSVTGLLLACLCLPAFAAEQRPRFVTENGRHALLVDGAPYTVLAAQLHNSSAWPAVLPGALDQVVALNANTVEAPIYWEQFEPSPGRYDTTNVDALIEQARRRNLRVALLWFGSWKNGQMHYVPEWIKRDPATYPRTLDERGEPVDVLSPHASANVEADARAFAALMQHLRKVDGQRHTVILVQVENEPGAIGAVRDHGTAANAAFAQPVPAAITTRLGKPAGTWRDVFGPEADEAFNAYATAHYIEQVAAAGKRAYDMPMYVNTWLRYKGKGRLQAVAEQPGQSKRSLRFGDWEVRVSYGAPYWGDADPILPGNADHGGRLLVAQTAKEQFLLTGFSARAEFVRVANDALHGQLLRVEQGRYVNGTWQFERLLNGDQTDYGLNFVREDPPVLRVTVGTY